MYFGMSFLALWMATGLAFSTVSTEEGNPSWYAIVATYIIAALVTPALIIAALLNNPKP
jgi:hypothetical protein